jgi:hypothetical protein
MYTRERIIEAAKRAGLDDAVVERLLAELPAQQVDALTIICNEGVHPISKEQLPGGSLWRQQAISQTRMLECLSNQLLMPVGVWRN